MGIARVLLVDARIKECAALQGSLRGLNLQEVSFDNTGLSGRLRMNLDPTFPGDLGQRIRQLLKPGPVGTSTVK